MPTQEEFDALQAQLNTANSDLATAKDKVNEFRTNNTELMKKNDDVTNKYSHIDLEAYADMQSQAKLNKDKKLIDEGKIDELLEARTQDLREKHLKEMADLQDLSKLQTKQISAYVIDDAVKTAAIKLGVVETGVDDLIARAHNMFQVKEGKAVSLDAQGNTIFAEGKNESMGVEEWVTGLADKAPHLFKSSNGSGSQHGQKLPSGTNTMRRANWDKLSHPERQAFAKDKGKVID